MKYDLTIPCWTELASVRDVMTKDIPKVDATDSVLAASKIMNQKKYTGVVVMQSGKPIGMLTDRAILRRFVNLNRKPEDVQVHEVMAPLLKIKADAPVKEALKMMVANSWSRIGVMDDGNLVGWITLTDAARESSKEGLVDMLLRRNQSDADDEMLCPRCRSAAMVRIVGKREMTLKWQPSWECPNCHNQD